MTFLKPFDNDWKLEVLKKLFILQKKELHL